jgi:hypothetical protein
MGAEVLIPLAISAIGSGAQAYNSYDTAKDQDAEAAAGIRSQANYQREADARLNEEIGALERSTPEGASQSALEQYMTQLQRTRAQAQGSNPGVPGASNEFVNDTAAANKSVGNYGDRLAGIMSRISAPDRQRQAETTGFNRAAGDVQGIGRNANGSAFLSELRSRGIRNNPWVDLGGKLVQNAGAAAGDIMGPDAGTSRVLAAGQRQPARLAQRGLA